MSKGKSNPAQSAMFNAGEELPLFTQSAYGSGVAPFVPVDTGKQDSMFPPTFAELAEAAAKKKVKKARPAGGDCVVCHKPGSNLHGNGRWYCDDHDDFGIG